MKTVGWLLAAALFGLAFAGCYTMLAHPTTDASWDTGQTVRHCSDCHESTDYYYWHNPYYNSWNWRSPYWRSYYGNPWWWDDYWYWDDDGHGGGGVAGEKRNLWQPRTSTGDPTPGLPGGSNEKVKESPRNPGTGPATGQGETERVKTNKEKRLFQPRKPAEKPKDDKEPEKKERKSKDK
jgi:hypothetical protein